MVSVVNMAHFICSNQSKLTVFHLCLQTNEEDFLVDDWSVVNHSCSENIQQKLGLGVRIHSVHICPEGKMDQVTHLESLRKLSSSFMHKYLNTTRYLNH